MYIKTNWENLPSESTPINASNLNKIENGIYDNSINIENLSNKVANITGEILWTNSNPTSDFSAQTITLNSSDYDMLIWISKGAYEAVITAYSIKGYGARLLDITGNTNTRRRTITYTNSTSYTIENAYGEDGSTKNGALIPLYVIGYKTGLFN